MKTRKETVYIVLRWAGSVYSFPVVVCMYKGCKPPLVLGPGQFAVKVTRNGRG